MGNGWGLGGCWGHNAGCPGSPLGRKSAMSARLTGSRFQSRPVHWQPGRGEPPPPTSPCLAGRHVFTGLGWWAGQAGKAGWGLPPPVGMPGWGNGLPNGVRKGGFPPGGNHLAGLLWGGVGGTLTGVGWGLVGMGWELNGVVKGLAQHTMARHGSGNQGQGQPKYSKARLGNGQGKGTRYKFKAKACPKKATTIQGQEPRNNGTGLQEGQGRSVH